MTGLLIERAELTGRSADIRVRDGLVVALAGRLSPLPGEDVFDADGGALIPGLHDHHIHLLALAAARGTVVIGPPAVTDHGGLAAALHDADRRQPAGDWLRAVGYHESVAGDLDRWHLDALMPDRPLRVQHRSGAMWVLNSTALKLVGVGRHSPTGVERDRVGQPTGRLFRLDGWLRERVPATALDLAAVGRELVGYGLCGVTDATPTELLEDLRLLGATVADGRLPLTVLGMTGPGLADRDTAAAVKLVIGDHALPELGDLVARIETAHRHRRPVAIHCVTRVAALLALAAWDEAGPGPGDRMEHGAVLGAAEAARLAAHGITVVTQPNFVAERGDQYRAEVEADDLADLWPCASLLEAGVAVGGGTDAPYGHPDPWRAIAAAVERRTATGAILGAAERLAPARALELFLASPAAPGGPPRRVAVGQPADLCVLHAPLVEVLHSPTSDLVAATVCRGRISV